MKKIENLVKNLIYNTHNLKKKKSVLSVYPINITSICWATKMRNML